MTQPHDDMNSPADPQDDRAHRAVDVLWVRNEGSGEFNECVTSFSSWFISPVNSIRGPQGEIGYWRMTHSLLGWFLPRETV